MTSPPPWTGSSSHRVTLAMGCQTLTDPTDPRTPNQGHHRTRLLDELEDSSAPSSIPLSGTQLSASFGLLTHPHSFAAPPLPRSCARALMFAYSPPGSSRSIMSDFTSLLATILQKLLRLSIARRSPHPGPSRRRSLPAPVSSCPSPLRRGCSRTSTPGPPASAPGVASCAPPRPPSPTRSARRSPQSRSARGSANVSLTQQRNSYSP